MRKCVSCGESCDNDRCEDCQRHFDDLGRRWMMKQQGPGVADALWYCFAALCWGMFLVYLLTS